MMLFSLSKLHKLFLSMFMFYVVENEGGGEPPAAKPPVIDPAQKFSAEYVTELREEAKSWRVKAQTAETAMSALKTLSDSEKLASNSAVEAANTKANERVIRSELKAAAIKAGMIDLDGLKLADLSKVTLSESGEVEGADVMLAELKTGKPYLFGVANSTNTNTPPPPNPPAAKHAKDMTEEEYKASKQAYLSTGK